MVYQLLEKNALCDYYALNEKPGNSLKQPVRRDKFAFLEDEEMAATVILYKDAESTHVQLYLPQIHCSSCLYLLENLPRLQDAVSQAKLNFPRKEIHIVFDHHRLSLRELVELLTQIGYEPYISLKDLKREKPRISRSLIYQLGITGFCFANIMLLSFPEYLGLNSNEAGLQLVFRWLSLLLALPVILYGARPFFESGWKGLQHGFLNIDAPIALAIAVTFIRSVTEVVSGTGSGYFDSMSGIVFFMLAGRILQDKTYQQLSFDRDYSSYFPLAVTKLDKEGSQPVSLPQIKLGDTLLIHADELIPADGILTRGRAMIDYSFVTGEAQPVQREIGEIIYAGGRQTGANIELLVIKEVAQSYLTSLWSRETFKEREEKKDQSYVHALSRYFTYIVFAIAALSALFWGLHDPSKIWNVITSILIVACPCALLLSHNFTNGNILRILARNRFYLRSARTIEAITRINHIVFDKTGTLSSRHLQDISYEGTALLPQEEKAVASLAMQSAHPLSISLAAHFNISEALPLQHFKQIAGQGVQATVNNMFIRLGSAAFTGHSHAPDKKGTAVYLSIDGQTKGRFAMQHSYRPYLGTLLQKISHHYKRSLLSGDLETEQDYLSEIMGKDTCMRFRQDPANKLEYIYQLQEAGDRVMMIGDGLNDAGALKQSDVGVAIAEDSNHFTPASDAILEASGLSRLQDFIWLCQKGQGTIRAAFALSILYNIVGLGLAVQGYLSPMYAAILMPASSVSILLITYGATSWLARRRGL